MKRSEKELNTRLAQLKREVPTRGFEQHPLMVKHVSEMPTELQSPTVSSLAASADIQTIITFPPRIHRGWHYVPKQALLFTPTDVIHVQASIWPDEEPQTTYLKGSGLMYMKATLLLLYGFLEIVAQGEGSPTQLGVEFNTVAWYQISRPLRQLLRASQAGPSAPADEPAYITTVYQALENLPLKFSNGAKIYGILPGEELEDLVFQPGVWKRQLLSFRRPVLPDTLLLLTSNYVVVVQEDLHVKQGWIFSYIPRSSISGMQSRPHGPRSELTIRLKRGEQTAEYKLLLEDEAIQAWRARWVQHGGQWQDIPTEV